MVKYSLNIQENLEEKLEFPLNCSRTQEKYQSKNTAVPKGKYQLI